MSKFDMVKIIRFFKTNTDKVLLFNSGLITLVQIITNYYKHFTNYTKVTK